jgi:hypothetical protein
MMDSLRLRRIAARYRNSPIDRDCTAGFRVSVTVDN